MNCGPPGSSVLGVLPAGVSCHSLLQGMDFPDPGILPAALTSPAWAGGFFTTNATREAHYYNRKALSRLLEKKIREKKTHPFFKWVNLMISKCSPIKLCFFLRHKSIISCLSPVRLLKQSATGWVAYKQQKLLPHSSGCWMLSSG